MANLAHRLFLDTNVLFSAAYSEDSDFQRLWQLADTTLIISTYILNEVLRHIAEPSRLERLGRLLTDLEIIENWAHVSLPDEMATLRQKDIPVIQAAIAAQATHLITGDRHDFGDYFGQTIEDVEITRPAEYLRRHF